MNDESVMIAGNMGAAVAAVLEPIYMQLAMTDPEVVAAVGEYEAGRPRNEFVEMCIKVGVMAVRGARGLVDGEAIRKSGELLMGQLGEKLEGFRSLALGQIGSVLAGYFDPASGSFSARVESLIRNDGEIERVIRAPVQEEANRLKASVEALVGPDGRLSRLLGAGDDNEFIRSLNANVKALLATEQDRVTEQFSLDLEHSALSRLLRELRATHGDLNEALAKRMQDVVAEFSLDKKDSALSRLVSAVTDQQVKISGEFSLDNPTSALRRMASELLGHINTGHQQQAQFQAEVMSLLTALNARKEAERASTTHGMIFEERVGQALREELTRAGDIVEDCGSTTGVIRASKVGDFIVTLSPESAAAGARIVVEAKESGAYTLKSTLEEADVARRNRGADITVFVHSARTVPGGIEMLARYGDDIIVVWDAENPETNVALRAALLLAKTMCNRKAKHSSAEAASYAAIDKAIEALRKQMEGFGELKVTAETVERSGQKMQERVRIMTRAMDSALETLVDQMAKVRTDGGSAPVVAA
jgi:hypothetical protein